ncbi:MAG TPA: alkaline phosphatase D family protein [Actinomycetes bacterium]|nr:alkaline phosphatase D family protein [Actinomycetes bacterium]
MSRRTFLLGGLALAAGASQSAPGGVPWGAGDPFTLGVASGDPWPTGVVLWTRLAPEPLADNGRGGMPRQAVTVDWQVAGDPSFRRVLRSGTVRARPERVHAVHVEVGGLAPGAELFYRFRVGPYLSPPGRTRTAPSPLATPAARLAVASCANYSQGWYTAYRRIAEEDPDLVLFLGDYIYEYAARPGDVREVLGPEASTLDTYRLRYSQYKLDPDLQAAHQVAPWVVTLDDHELQNDWAADVDQHGHGGPAFLARRAAAFEAFWEHMPLRRTSMPAGPHMQLYRRLDWGRLASFHVLDTRQYRSAPTCGSPRCDRARNDPRRSITGAEQERWLLQGLASSPATWQVLAQQVMFASLDRAAGPATDYSGGNWNGYVASRRRVIDGIVRRHVRNPLVLTGDAHQHLASDLKADFADPDSPVVGAELVGTSIASGGDGSDHSEELRRVLPENPHVKFQSSRRGYLRCHVDASTWRTDLVVLPYVSRPGAPALTAASFVIEDGRPGLQRA